MTLEVEDVERHRARLRQLVTDERLADERVRAAAIERVGDGRRARVARRLTLAAQSHLMR